MKKILILICIVSLLATTGCIIAEDGGRGHGHGGGGRHSTVIVPAPVIIVPAVRVHH